MKTQKIKLLLTLTAVLVLLCGCDGMNFNSGDNNGQESAEKMADREIIGDKSDKDKLTDLLGRVNNNVQAGTAGSSLKAAIVAADFLEWGTNNRMTPEEAKAVTVEWLTEKGNDEQVQFAENLRLVDDTVKAIQGDKGKDLLESAGRDYKVFPWGSEPEPLIEAVMDATGLR